MDERPIINEQFVKRLIYESSDEQTFNVLVHIASESAKRLYGFCDERIWGNQALRLSLVGCTTFSCVHHVKIIC